MLSADNGNGLGWLDSDDTHYFYAVYPSPGVTGAQSTIAAGEGNAVTVTGVIPATQTLSWSGTTGTPDMKYAYMYASASSTPSSSVNLTFQPQFTAFQFEIGIAQSDGYTYDYGSITLTEFTLTTCNTDYPLVGTFSIDGNPDGKTITATGTGLGTTVPIGQTLTAGNPLILTVFALPQELHDLTISFTGNEIGTRTLALMKNGEYMSFDKCKKYRFYGMYFPKVGIVTSGEGIINWNGSCSILTDGNPVAWTGFELNNSEGEDLNTWSDSSASYGSEGEGIGSWTQE